MGGICFLPAFLGPESQHWTSGRVRQIFLSRRLRPPLPKRVCPVSLVTIARKFARANAAYGGKNSRTSEREAILHSNWCVAQEITGKKKRGRRAQKKASLCNCKCLLVLHVQQSLRHTFFPINRAAFFSFLSLYLH